MSLYVVIFCMLHAHPVIIHYQLHVYTFTSLSDINTVSVHMDSVLWYCWVGIYCCQDNELQITPYV
jgi:putative methionine-R-sulfoxide reductase with GAF domain